MGRWCKAKICLRPTTHLSWKAQPSFLLLFSSSFCSLKPYSYIALIAKLMCSASNGLPESFILQHDKNTWLSTRAMGPVCLSIFSNLTLSPENIMLVFRMSRIGRPERRVKKGNHCFSFWQWKWNKHLTQIKAFVDIAVKWGDPRLAVISNIWHSGSSQLIMHSWRVLADQSEIRTQCDSNLIGFVLERTQTSSLPPSRFVQNVPDCP